MPVNAKKKSPNLELFEWLVDGSRSGIKALKVIGEEDHNLLEHHINYYRQFSGAPKSGCLPLDLSSKNPLNQVSSAANIKILSITGDVSNGLMQFFKAVSHKPSTSAELNSETWLRRGEFVAMKNFGANLRKDILKNLVTTVSKSRGKVYVVGAMAASFVIVELTKDSFAKPVYSCAETHVKPHLENILSHPIADVITVCALVGTGGAGACLAASVYTIYAGVLRCEEYAARAANEAQLKEVSQRIKNRQVTSRSRSEVKSIKDQVTTPSESTSSNNTQNKFENFNSVEKALLLAFHIKQQYGSAQNNPPSVESPQILNTDFSNETRCIPESTWVDRPLNNMAEFAKPEILNFKTPKEIFLEYAKKSVVEANPKTEFQKSCAEHAEKTIQKQQFSRFEEQHWAALDAANKTQKHSGFVSSDSIGYKYHSNTAEVTAAVGLGTVAVGVTFTGPLAPVVGAAVVAAVGLTSIIHDSRRYKLTPVEILKPMSDSSSDDKKWKHFCKKFYEWEKKPNKKNLNKLNAAYEDFKTVSLKNNDANYARDAIWHFVKNAKPSELKTTQPDFEKIGEQYQTHLEKNNRQERIAADNVQIKQNALFKTARDNFNLAEKSRDPETMQQWIEKLPTELQSQAREIRQNCIDKLAYESICVDIDDAIKNDDLPLAMQHAEKNSRLKDHLQKQFNSLTILCELRKPLEAQNTDLLIHQFNELLHELKGADKNESSYAEEQTQFFNIKDAVFSRKYDENNHPGLLNFLKESCKLPNISQEQKSQCYFQAGQVYQTQDTYKSNRKAFNHFKKAFNADSTNSENCLALASEHRKRGEYAKADSVTEKFTETADLSNLPQEKRDEITASIVSANRHTDACRTEAQLLGLDFASFCASKILEKMRSSKIIKDETAAKLNAAKQGGVAVAQHLLSRKLKELTDYASHGYENWQTGLSAVGTATSILKMLANEGDDTKWVDNVAHDAHGAGALLATGLAVLEVTGKLKRTKKIKEVCDLAINAADKLQKTAQIVNNGTLTTSMRHYAAAGLKAYSVAAPLASFANAWYFDKWRKNGEAPTSKLGVLAEDFCYYSSVIGLPLSIAQTEIAKAAMFNLSEFTALHSPKFIKGIAKCAVKKSTVLGKSVILVVQAHPVIAGIVIGAVLIGGIWYYCENRSYNNHLNNIEAKLTLASQKDARKYFTEARSLANESLKIYKDDPKLKANLQKIQEAEKEFEENFIKLKDARKKYFDDVTNHVSLPTMKKNIDAMENGFKDIEKYFSLSGLSQLKNQIRTTTVFENEKEAWDTRIK
ncbi:MAG: hypothetical protein NTZ67_03470 [Gammaproteobacteria bacterium]|nr:hypothetical protein [Gammaproteobacteria bacterium]